MECTENNKRGQLLNYNGYSYTKKATNTFFIGALALWQFSENSAMAVIHKNEKYKTRKEFSNYKK